MIARVSNVKCFIILLIIISFSYGRSHITKDTIWSSEKLLSESVVIDEGATLTINSGVKVKIKYVDMNADNLGDIRILVLGVLKIDGTLSAPVVFEPLEPSSNKDQWVGIIINSKESNNSLRYFSLSNASTGIDINSRMFLQGVTIQDPGKTGINIRPIQDGSVIIKDVTILNSSGHGVIINSPNVIINWMRIESCSGHGLVNESLGIVLASNLRIINASNTGLFNHGDISITNAIIEHNRHGVISFSGNLDIEGSSIRNNRVNGLLLGGDGDNTIVYTSIEKNSGYGIETTKWSQAGLNGTWSQSSGPILRVNNCNIVSNHQTSVLDKTVYEGLWDDWTDAEYSGDGWIDGWNARLIKKIPFGRIGWIGFDYTSNNGGSDFSWQPCTGNSVWSYIAELRDARNQKLTYLTAPFQCYWNPLEGENSNTWHNYENFTGLINKTNDYTNWQIEAQDIPNSDSYSIWQYFEHAYVPLSGTDQYARPVMKNIKLRFYHGGYEVSSYSDNEAIDLGSNYWGQKKGIDTLFNPHGALPINYSDFRSTEIGSAYSLLNETNKILFIEPVVRSSHQEVKTMKLAWKTYGWIPVIDIAVSTDAGRSWTNIVEDIDNTGEYSWWNNLITGETFFLRINHSNDTTVANKIGPLFVVENVTPTIGSSTNKLDFRSKLSSLQFSILNEGGGTLPWSVSDNQKWLSLSRKTGVTKNRSVITATVDRTAMSSGNYRGVIRIKSDAGDIPIKVRMEIAKPNINISTKRMDFDSTLTEMSFDIVNQGGSYIKWNAKPDSEWIILSKESGTTLDRDVVIVKVDRALIKDSLQNGIIKISSKVGNSSIRVAVTQIAQNTNKQILPNIPNYAQYPCGTALIDNRLY